MEPGSGSGGGGGFEGEEGRLLETSDYPPSPPPPGPPAQIEGLVGRETVLQEGFLYVCCTIVNSPAFLANVQPGDVICQFGGINKTNFPGLKTFADQVGACANGTLIKVVVLRHVPTENNELYQHVHCEMRIFRRPGGRGALGMVINTWPPPRPLVTETPAPIPTTQRRHTSKRSSSSGETASHQSKQKSSSSDHGSGGRNGGSLAHQRPQEREGGRRRGHHRRSSMSSMATSSASTTKRYG